MLETLSVQKEKPHKHEEVATSNKVKLKGRSNNRDLRVDIIHKIVYFVPHPWPQ